jgi:hypothetical protein
MNLIQNSIIVICLAILFKGYLIVEDIKQSPDNTEYSHCYTDFEYEVIFKRETIVNDSLYYIVTVMDSKYKESERVVSKNEYVSLKKKDVIKERKLKNDIDVIFYLSSVVFAIVGIMLFLWTSTYKSFVLFSLKDFE